MVRVAFQGERGAFTEDAVLTFFDDCETVPLRYLGEVFQNALGKTDFGVVPVENSQAGSINETYDLLLEYPLNIYGEIILRVNHCLIALPGETLDGIRVVHSHPQALAQCQEYLSKLKVDLIPEYNTAGSAKKIKDEGLQGHAAIASKRAARLYGLELLAADIETNKQNFTRFFAICRENARRADVNKTSIVFGIKNIPGALYSIMETFANRNINLTKLESRPSKNKPWEYVFYADFEGHQEDPVCHEALLELGQKISFVKILGSYPSATS
jgi:chorismate mutase/prephenate dehydratase